jgi:RNA polymerase sigma-70 factor (ECF subfamily)
VSDVEPELTALLLAHRYHQAATLAIATYGPELYGFLVHLMGSDGAAADVFSQASEDLWNGLATFGGRCSMRSWMYVLARHAAARHRRSPWHRPGRRGESALDAAIADARSRTAPWLQTEVKDQWRALRESLEPDDRTLLVLRVDRDLTWPEIARVMIGEEDPTPEALDRETVRLRKRFQLLKTELRDRARAAGLVGDE